MSEDQLLTAMQAVRRLGIGKTSFYALIKAAGIKPVVVPGAKVGRYRLSELHAATGQSPLPQPADELIPPQWEKRSKLRSGASKAITAFAAHYVESRKRIEPED